MVLKYPKHHPLSCWHAAKNLNMIRIENVVHNLVGKSHHFNRGNAGTQGDVWEN